MKQWLVFVLGLVAASWAWGKCEGLSVKTTTPTKFLVYHTDKAHRSAYEKYPIKYELDHDELSQSETLFHISHGKKLDKTCTLSGIDAKKHSLKQKDYLVVKSANYVGDKFVMNLDDDEFKTIECKGVSTLQDLKDVMEPYLMFNCKDKVAYEPAPMNRLPASAAVDKPKK